MNHFLKTYRLALTPLSPIHIGCGEDFEPTNYVIDEGVLYGFDPSRAALNDLQKGKLIAAASNASLLGIQRFFRDNAKDFMAHADVLIPVSSGVADKYESAIGRVANTEANGNQVVNNLAVERTSYTGKLRQPYIPGSSFKGALRTAWLDELNGQQIPNDVQFSFKGEAKSTTAMEKRLFKGDFSTSPTRLLKVADLMPAPDTALARRVLYAVNLKKKQIIKDGNEVKGQSPTVRKECILHGQFRAFVTDAVLPQLQTHHTGKETPALELRPTDLKALAQQSNAYSLTRLRREMVVLDGRGFVNPDWKKSVEVLINGELKAKLDGGTAFLIRLGRYGGAESKTLSGEGVANIKIMGAKGQPPSFESTTKTVWLAAERESDHRHLLPFGWAIVEIDPKAGDAPQLKAWCETQSKGRPDMAAKRLQFEVEKAAAEQRKNEMRLETLHREAAKQAEIATAAARAQALATMSPQAQRAETLRQKCEELDIRITGGNFKKQSPDAGKAGLYQDAMQLAKLALESTDWTASDKQALADMLEQWLPKVVGPWDAKEQRKKLKFAALRGLA